MLFDDITNPDNFKAAFNNTKRGRAKYKISAIEFSSNETLHLQNLLDEVVSGEYAPGTYNEFVVYWPKERTILSPKYRDKIVQHAVNNVLRDFFEPKFIYDSYRGKGNQRAVLRVQEFMRRAYINYESPWVVRADVKKFFYSMSRDVLKSILSRRIPCEKTLLLLFKIIDSSPGEGLPLGNLSSQLLANVLMDEIDQHLKRRCGVKFYVRYADDLFIIMEGRSSASSVLEEIKKFGKDVLHLEFPDRKSYITPLTLNGVCTLGFRITPYRIGLTSATRNAFIGKLKLYDRLLSNGSITHSEIKSSIVSWLSHASLADCDGFLEKCNAYTSFPSSQKVRKPYDLNKQHPL